MEKKYEARGKVVKNSGRDGLEEKNLATGEVINEGEKKNKASNYNKKAAVSNYGERHKVTESKSEIPAKRRQQQRKPARKQDKKQGGSKKSASFEKEKRQKGKEKHYYQYHGIQKQKEDNNKDKSSSQKKQRFYKSSRGAVIKSVEFFSPFEGRDSDRKQKITSDQEIKRLKAAKRFWSDRKKVSADASSDRYETGPHNNEQTGADLSSDQSDQKQSSRMGPNVRANRIKQGLYYGAHKALEEAEEDNMGVEAAHKTEIAAETGYKFYKKISNYKENGSSRYGFQHRSRNTAGRNFRQKSRQNIVKNEKTEKATGTKATGTANRAATGQKTAADSSSNNQTLNYQKQKYKMMYQRAKRAAMANKATTEALTQQIFTRQTFITVVKAAAKVIAAKAKIIGAIVAAVLLLLISFGSIIEGALTLVSGVFGDGISTITAQTTYVSSDEDIYAAEDYYVELENGLDEDIQSIEDTYPGYDEYVYNVDEIGHNPYHLTSYLTALAGDYIFNDTIEDALDALFALQYTIETESKSETRTSISTVTDPNTGLETTVTTEYEYTILYVTVTNIGFGNVVASIGDTDLLNAYTMFNYTYGNRDYLWDIEYVFEDSYDTFEPPEEALDDEQFARMLDLIEQCLGTPYVWGGSGPGGFDCSGFVSYVLNNAGVSDAGRLTANGWYNTASPISYNDLQPGDLIFFQGTYNTTGASHIGIYVGDGMMAHAGDPVQYSSINTSYWQSHLLGYGRVTN